MADTKQMRLKNVCHDIKLGTGDGTYAKNSMTQRKCTHSVRNDTTLVQ